MFAGFTSRFVMRCNRPRLALSSSKAFNSAAAIKYGFTVAST
jgi:hypothetical protein